MRTESVEPVTNSDRIDATAKATTTTDTVVRSPAPTVTPR
jgi:hypothetical protein